MSEIIHAVPETARAATRTTIDDYRARYARSLADPDGFWRGEIGRLDWVRPPQIMGNWSWDPVDIRWFEDGVLNVSRQLPRSPRSGRCTAIIWEADDPTPLPARRVSYGELRDETCRMANALVALGVEKGDRVTIYLPMIPEAAVAMLACARIGADPFGGIRRLFGRGHRRPGAPMPKAASSSPPMKAGAAASRCR